MAKRERNKRAARKARQQERVRKEAAQAAAQSGAEEQSSRSLFKKKDAGAPSKASKPKVVAKEDRKGLAKVTGYFGDVRTEMHQVTWPTRLELRNYSVAVIVTLIVFGVAIWLVDTGFVAGLVQFTGLRG